MATKETDNKKPTTQRGVSPAGVAVFPFLNRPDEYKGAKNYKVTLRIGGDESESFRELIEKATEEAEADFRAKLEDQAKNGKDGKTKAKAKLALEELTTGLPFTEAVDDDGNGTGEYEFKFKCNAEYEDKKTGEVRNITVPLFDAKKKPTKAQIWGGSVLKVAYAMIPYYVESAKVCGVSLRIEGVQVLELSSGSGGRSADAFGFGEEEGYSAETDTPFGAGPSESEKDDEEF